MYLNSYIPDSYMNCLISDWTISPALGWTENLIWCSVTATVRSTCAHCHTVSGGERRGGGRACGDRYNEDPGPRRPR